MFKNILKHCILFLFGGSAYILIELLFRGYSHFSMFILGGILFIEIGLLNEFTSEKTGLLIEGILGSVIITISEFLAGLILNVWLGLNIWDYSDMPLNIMGQISLLYSFAWIFVAVAAVILDDYLRRKWFGEEKVFYKLF